MRYADCPPKKLLRKEYTQWTARQWLFSAASRSTEELRFFVKKLCPYNSGQGILWCIRRKQAGDIVCSAFACADSFVREMEL